jgi:cytochrome c oxidase subunit I+III
VYTYLEESGWGRLNLVASLGAVLIAAALVTILVDMIRSARRGAPAGANPWSADSLEWSMPSPPPCYGFLYLPTVRSRHPLWEEGPAAVVTGLRSDRRELLSTTLLEGRPDHRAASPWPSLTPFVAAVGAGIGMFASIFTPWGGPLAAVLAIPPLFVWGWPRDRRLEPEERVK